MAGKNVLYAEASRNLFAFEHPQLFEMKKTSIITAGSTLALSLCLGTLTASAEAWKFGVLSDTQWTSANDGKSPESIPASIIQQIDQAFIGQGVKVVISIGDVVDT